MSRCRGGGGAGLVLADDGDEVIEYAFLWMQCDCHPNVHDGCLPLLRRRPSTVKYHLEANNLLAVDAYGHRGLSSISSLPPWDRRFYAGRLDAADDNAARSDERDRKADSEVSGTTWSSIRVEGMRGGGAERLLGTMRLSIVSGFIHGHIKYAMRVWVVLLRLMTRVRAALRDGRRSAFSAIAVDGDRDRRSLRRQQVAVELDLEEPVSP
ncbi:hypothetical protein R3P38DRAFT_2797611 [Favolaschia claudopus]|uniref:Uncharacterized protein n=1 Tax=Favolaschia claudopus TaxID=2862362 RepID=A0AAW0A2Y8_9AGAR